MKPTRIIELGGRDLDQLAGFKDVPNRLETKEANYIFTTSTNKTPIVGSNTSLPYDLRLMVSVRSELVQNFLPLTNTYSISRMTKALQSVVLARWAEKNKDNPWLKNYHHLDTYSGCKHGSLPRTVPEGNYIIKPTTGARSMALIFLNTRKMHIHEFTTLLDMHINKHLPYCLPAGEKMDGVQLKDAPSDQPPVPFSERKITRTEMIEQFFEKHNIEYSRGYEYRQDEAATDIIDRNLIMQVMNPFPKEDVIEIRALQCLNVEPVMYYREDLSPDWNGYSTAINLSQPEKLTPTMASALNEIRECLRQRDFPSVFGSVDIWVHKPSGEWGIYEFQPEYSSINIRYADHMRFLADSIDAIWYQAESLKA